MGATTRASGEDKRRARGYYIKLKKLIITQVFFVLVVFISSIYLRELILRLIYKLGYSRFISNI